MTEEKTQRRNDSFLEEKKKRKLESLRGKIINRLPSGNFMKTGRASFSGHKAVLGDREGQGITGPPKLFSS